MVLPPRHAARGPRESSTAAADIMERTSRYSPPAPRVKVIDLGAGDEDRFALPKASIAFSPDGKRLYGVQPRPACRVLRYTADAAAAAACAAADARQATPPGGRRHDAFLRYIEGLRHSEQQAEARSVPRPASPARGVYKAKLGGSDGVAGCMVWHPDLGRHFVAGSEGDEAAKGAGASPRSSGMPVRKKSEMCCEARPSTAPPAATLSPTGLDMWHTVTCPATSPRFQSRAAFEQRRAASPDIEAINKRGYLARHQQLRKVQAANEAREVELSHAWPHGLPTKMLLAARAEGLSPPAIERGFAGAQITRSC
ncbi:hypothetical protein ABPG75_002717 [Micractinium tetrahymenae]